MDNVQSLDVDEMEKSFLFAARNGDLKRVNELLDCLSNNMVQFNINCKGKNKSNFGWTALHLASYFGHRAVVETLLNHGADVDAINESGDTPLHKAAFIRREVKINFEFQICSLCCQS